MQAFNNNNNNQPQAFVPQFTQSQFSYLKTLPKAEITDKILASKLFCGDPGKDLTFALQLMCGLKKGVTTETAKHIYTNEVFSEQVSELYKQLFKISQFKVILPQMWLKCHENYIMTILNTLSNGTFLEELDRLVDLSDREVATRELTPEQKAIQMIKGFPAPSEASRSR